MSDSTLVSICETARREFEAAWRDARPEPIEKHLPPADDPRFLATLEELVHIEMEMRWKAGQGEGDTLVSSQDLPLAEAYLARFPQLAAPPVLLRLLKQEYRVRHLYGDCPSPQEYLARFPGQVKTDAEAETLVRGLTRGAGTPGRPPTGALPAIPGYEVYELLGRGGMGVVYKARQLGLNRIVALKMIRLGTRDDDENLARFRLEAEASAQLQHPNIVQIHEIGQVNGQPYFSLEYIEGGSLDRLLRGQPHPSRCAAEVVEKLARAMHYAHQKGILHRDLKPANVLLQNADFGSQTCNVATRKAAEEGESTILNLKSVIPKITDFGLAKRFEAGSSIASTGELTLTGHIMGTPAYMAPEQAAGRNKEVGPAADIYALGAILYEMVTGRPPFVGETFLDTLPQILDHEPVSPRRLQPSVPRDLETICLKCLEKSPQRRYASAEALADDLRHFLNGEPIQATPASWLRRVGKWARRRPAAAALLAGVILAVIGLLAGASWHNLQLQHERDQTELRRQQAVRAEADERLARKQAEDNAREAERQSKQAQAQRDRAQQRFRQARDAVEHLLELEKTLADVPRLDDVRRKLLQDVLAFHDRFLQDEEADPKLRPDAVRALRTAGRIHASLQDHAQARKAYERALSLQQRIADEAPEGDGHRKQLAEIHLALGRVHIETRNFKETEAAFGKALGIVRELAETHSGHAGYRQALAETYGDLAAFYQVSGRKDPVEFHRKALEIREELAREYPENADHRRGVATVLNNLGLFLENSGSLEPAEEMQRRALRIRQDLADKDKKPEALLSVSYGHNNLGRVLEKLKQWDEAEAGYREALKIQEKLVQEYPSRPEYQRVLAVMHLRLSACCRHKARAAKAREAFDEEDRHLDAAEKHLRRSIKEHEPLRPFADRADYVHGLGVAHGDLALLLEEMNRLSEAEAELRRALEIRRRLVQHPESVPLYQSELAGVCDRLARLLLKRATTLANKPRQPKDWFHDVWPALLRLEAAELMEEAIASRSKLSAKGENHFVLLRNYYSWVADTRLLLGDHAAASVAAAELPRLIPKDWQEYHRAALFLVRAGKLAERDISLTETQRGDLREQYWARAVRLLHDAVDQRIPAEAVTEQNGFAVLRERQDFQALLQKLKTP